MKFFRYLLLSVLFIVLFSVYHHFDRLGFFQDAAPQKTDKMSAEQEEEHLVLGSLEEINSFILTRKNLRLKAVETPSGWELVSPVRGQMQDKFLKVLFKALHELNWKRSFTVVGEDLLRYGLQPPQYELAWTSNEGPKQQSLQIGFRTPNRKHIYVRLNDEARVLLLAGNIKPVLQMPLEKIRIPKLFSISAKEVKGFESKWKKNHIKGQLKGEFWQMILPKKEGMGKAQVRDYLAKIWTLPVQDYAGQGDFPSVDEKNYLKFDLADQSEFILYIGKENLVKEAFPVYSPKDQLKVWVESAALKPLLEVSAGGFQSRSFMRIPEGSIVRATIKMRNRKFFFVSRDGLWRFEKDRKKSVSYEPFEFLFTVLNELQYLRKLSLNEKSVLFLDPGEVGMVIDLTRTGQTKPGMELKFYIRNDFNYLEINSSPPLYVLPNDTVQKIYQVIQPLVDDPKVMG